jgi:hypothetical protein
MASLETCVQLLLKCALLLLKYSHVRISLCVWEYPACMSSFFFLLWHQCNLTTGITCLCTWLDLTWLDFAHTGNFDGWVEEGGWGGGVTLCGVDHLASHVLERGEGKWPAVHWLLIASWLEREYNEDTKH